MQDSGQHKLSRTIKTFFEKNKSVTFKEINGILKKVCGISDFFSTEEDYVNLCFENDCRNRLEYGDFQTNMVLAQRIAKNIKQRGISPQIIIEPTCGYGNFLVAALETFDNIEKIFAVEISENYVKAAKYQILDFFLNNPDKQPPETEIFNSDVFNFGFEKIKRHCKGKNILILGNPPWVTNSKLSVFNSANLPNKTNFKNAKGIEAITGKGNFDVAEYICYILLQHFGCFDGNLALLVKNTVIKNILYRQKAVRFPISNIEKLAIDSKKEFGVSADASLFFCRLNSNPQEICSEFDFYEMRKKSDFGWQNGRFMSDINTQNIDIEGVCQLEWRQGVKHDCTKVMELERIDGGFKNKLGETFNLEDDLVYDILKSSDLQQYTPDFQRKCTIITQKKAGESTDYIKNFPLTYNYLERHVSYFDSRKSVIYKNKPKFSIFGIGDYSFKPYKVAISGLYKNFRFTLVKPLNGKPVMLDDTCYFLGFDDLEQAETVLKLLNTEITGNFLRSIAFSDSKRMITKELLMRIDLFKIEKNTNGKSLSEKGFVKKEKYSQAVLF